ncbi:MAG: family 20 glycosylhydrolase [Planctomycetota bacterium]|nr:family 20 glycosylhydrolase [Planctomycetota bacterium]
MRKRSIGVLWLPALVLSCAGVSVNAGNPLNLLPTPKVLKVDGGAMPLTADSRLVATEAKLKPLADILADEILLVTKLRPAVVEGEGKAGDIVLIINPKLQADADILTVHGQEVLKTREYAHTMAVTDRVVIEGWDYRAVCEGTVTFLQAIVVEGNKVSVPKMTLKDWPYSDYSAIMIDCARQHQPIYVLKLAVETCRLFKVRYLHLHLSDDSAFTFPSTAYPEASSVHSPPVTPYTLAELKDLVAYADARGVTCVPEMEGPGHCTAMLDGMKGKLGRAGNAPINWLKPGAFAILDTIVGEMCDVFKSSPYFHFGGDEVGTGLFGDPLCDAYVKEHHLTGEHTLWIPYTQEMVKIVKKHGKKPVMWDGQPVGCPLDPSLAKDVILYAWFPRKGQARAAQDMGYTTITAPWDLPPFPEFNMFTCNNDVLTRKDKVLGHCRPMWEMDMVALANSFLPCTPERHERTWGPDNVIESDYLKNRMARQNARADLIARPVTFSFAGTIKEGVFNDPLTVTMSTTVPGVQIRYRVDGEEPALESPLYEKPFQAAESLSLRASLFDKDGKRLGYTTLASSLRYVHFEPNLTTGKPVTAESVGGTPEAPEKAEYAVDGWVDETKFWGTIPGPKWLKVDLQKEYPVDRIQVVPLFDGIRYYQYTVEVSTDDKVWTPVADASKNTTVGTEKGYMHKFAPTKARYIRVNVLKNSDNPATHLVEVRAWETGK